METEFAALVAIDWADQKHAWMLQVQGSSDREAGTIDHTPEAVDVWAAELALRFGGQPVAVALEQSRGPLVFMLAKYEHLVIFPVHPTTLANYRKSFRPSGAKNDPSDAGLLLDVLTLHRDKLRRLNPDTPETRTLQFLVEERRKLVHEKTRYSNRLPEWINHNLAGNAFLVNGDYPLNFVSQSRGSLHHRSASPCERWSAPGQLLRSEAAGCSGSGWRDLAGV
jgi:hypothetical protein